jgi:hypothetical protein
VVPWARRRRAKFGLRMASGKESGAYTDEWVAGGETLGGADEAVIDALGLDDLQAGLDEGTIEIRPEKFPETPGKA